MNGSLQVGNPVRRSWNSRSVPTLRRCRRLLSSLSLSFSFACGRQLANRVRRGEGSGGRASLSRSVARTRRRHRGPFRRVYFPPRVDSLFSLLSPGQRSRLVIPSPDRPNRSRLSCNPIIYHAARCENGPTGTTFPFLGKRSHLN